MAHLDFVVVGTPKSANAETRSKVRWKAQVASAARDAWGDKPPITAAEVSITIVYFYRDLTGLDVDNIAKLIVDGIKGVAIDDDSLASQVTLRKTDQSTTDLDTARSVLVPHFGVTSDFVYVAIGDGPDHKRLPE